MKLTKEIMYIFILYMSYCYYFGLWHKLEYIENI